MRRLQVVGLTFVLACDFARGVRRSARGQYYVIDLPQVQAPNRTSAVSSNVFWSAGLQPRTSITTIVSFSVPGRFSWAPMTTSAGPRLPPTWCRICWFLPCAAPASSRRLRGWQAAFAVTTFYAVNSIKCTGSIAGSDRALFAPASAVRSARTGRGLESVLRARRTGGGARR